MEPLYSHDLIVVTIPAYNEERYIGEAIASLKAQEWTDFLVVISDNASSDATEKVCQTAIANDPRFHYVRQPRNLGAAGNGKWLYENTKSPYIMSLGAHDRVTPEYLGDHLRILQAEPQYSLSYSLTQWIDEAGAPVNVTDPSCIGDLRGPPLRRYFDSIRQLRECTAINNVLRRNMIGPIREWEVPGVDMIALSQLLYHGPAHRIDRPQYQRRKFASREADYMERLTGRPGIAREDAELIKGYLAGFDELTMGRPTRLLVRPLLKSLLMRRRAASKTTLDKLSAAVTRLLGL